MTTLDAKRAKLSPNGPISDQNSTISPLSPMTEEVFSLAERLGWTDSRLAWKLGIDHRTVHAWRKGEREPSLTHVFLARAHLAIRLTCPALAEELTVPSDFYAAADAIVGGPLRLSWQPTREQMRACVLDGADVPEDAR